MKIGTKYHLGDGENFFIYRTDKYNNETVRADLFRSDGEKIATTPVKGGMTHADKTHHDVINGFEVFVMMN